MQSDTDTHTDAHTDTHIDTHTDTHAHRHTRTQTHTPLSIPLHSEAFWLFPLMRSATAQSRSYAFVGPSSWNDLPQQLHLELLTLPLPLSENPEDYLVC